MHGRPVSLLLSAAVLAATLATSRALWLPRRWSSLSATTAAAVAPAEGVATAHVDPFTPAKCLSTEDVDAAVQRFSQLLQFRTVSSPLVPLHVVEPEQMRELHEWMPSAFPEVWGAMAVEEVRAASALHACPQMRR
jgi:hypothetical protein